MSYIDCGVAGSRHWGERGAAGLLFVSVEPNDVKYLLQHRAAWTDHGLTWGVPGGALEDGETSFHAACREASEEMLLPLFPKEKDCGVVVFHCPNCEWQYVTFIARMSAAVDVRPLSAETIACDWVSSYELQSLRLHPGFEYVLNRIVRGDVWRRSTSDFRLGVVEGWR